MDYAARVAAVREAMAREGLDLVVIGHPADRQYLSGFAAQDASSVESAGWIVLGPSDGFFLTTFNFFELTASEVRHLEPVKATRRLPEALAELLGKLPGRAIGFEADWLVYSLYEELTRGLAADRTLSPISGLVERLREVKDAEELEIIRQAIDITDQAYADVVARLKVGQSEREIAWLLERRLRELGADGMAFGPSVAAGPHAAVPHHESTDYLVKLGDPVWIDMGARLRGYCADLTRSFAVGNASGEFLETWALVLRAQERAITGLRAGLSGRDADALSRDVFERAGRGEEFGHSLGHGVGMQIHEAPLLGRRSDEVLRPGMVVTVEPGLYRTGWGGVRIEDCVLIEESGCTNLTRADKSPVISPIQ